MLEQLRGLLPPNVTPVTVMVDFEKAAINALKKVYPATTIRGCYFHFESAVNKHIRSTPELLRMFVTI